VRKEGNKPLVMKASSVEAAEPRESRDDANGKVPAVRTASNKQFEKAQRKTSKLHAGLFQRLAK
jgi:hypothetical protein